MFGFTPWIQPALTYTTGKFTVTPAASYASAFGTHGLDQVTAGIKLSYTVTDKWSVDTRFRREFNECSADANRLYVGAAYKF